eukprot:TRINITY_DN3902_c0_g1_i3.p1 TRINITY_DN3902_c0_g1~~TRINITY_DN3902_c0_g1_i3.p1  ORF type:complete len:192 (+),score=19.92 TRINITY_DN3902_c0_g1_i3:1394-1969(+)
MDGSFRDEKNRFKHFLTGGHAFVGFSESLTNLLKYAQTEGHGVDIADYSVQLLPLNVTESNLTYSTFYTDAFVLNPKCTGEGLKAATQLVKYLTSPSTYLWMLSSQDTDKPDVFPRYLIPPLNSLDSLLFTDPIFKQLTNLNFPCVQPCPFDFSIKQNELYNNIYNAIYPSNTVDPEPATDNNPSLSTTEV